jgi:hypothetical protein
LFDIATEIVAALAVTFETMMELTLLTEFVAGFKPVNAVVPSYVHAVLTAVEEGITYAVCPRIVPAFTRLGFAMIASYRLNTD